jgi:hypothetical protein
VGSGWRRRGAVEHGCRHGCEAGNGDDDDGLLALLRWSGGVGEERTPVRDGRADRKAERQRSDAGVDGDRRLSGDLARSHAK